MPAFREGLLAAGRRHLCPHDGKTRSDAVFWSGIMVVMNGKDAQDEPGGQAAPSGNGNPSGAREEDVPAQRTGVRLATAFGSEAVPGRSQDKFAESVAQSLAPQLQAALRQQLQPVLDALHVEFGALIARSLAPQLEAFRELASSVVPPLIEWPFLNLNLPADWFPRNWEDIPDLDIDTVISIVLDEGIPMVWVPRPAIVAALAAAADASARDGILVAARDEVAGDCLAVIGEITAAELKPLAGLAAEAVSALRDDHSSGAQALAGNVFDTLLRDAARRGVIFAGPPGGYFRYDKVRKKITPVSDDTVIRRFRTDCVLSAALPALQDYDPANPPPARFVRHATAHCTRPEQYTPVNAIVAVMLMASMLREAQASGW
ncbi:MAG TPA: hypothetical protein VFQ44_21655 [Streptosporangiaceae bacterium]|nr:hypothetical protein [Streptosporangiaceae bacterium]